MQINRRDTDKTPGRPTARPEPSAPALNVAPRMSADVLEKTATVVAASSATKARGGLGGLIDRLRKAATNAFDFVADKAVTHVVNPATRFLMWAAMDVDKRRLTYQSERNPSDVNRPREGELATAQAELKQHAGAEQAALAKLSPADRKRYESVSSQVANRPMSQRALQKMLLDGRLPGDKVAHGGAGLLAQFETMLTQPLAPGIDRAQLLGETLCEVEDPVRIAQHDKGTCGAGTAQILLTRQNPAEYVRLVNGLASPKGEVQMVGGATIARHADWAADNDGGRTLSTRLIQPAFMEYASELRQVFDYDNTADKHKLGPIKLFSGLVGWGMSDLLDQLTGRNYENFTSFRWNRESHWADLKQALEKGRGPVPVATTWGDEGSGHFVQVDRVEKGRVYFTNPWGEEGSATEAEFARHVTQVMLPRE